MHEAPRVLLVGGHESADGADLTRYALEIEGAIAANPGRAFHNTVSAALAEGQTVVVVPMTFGRNPTMVADTAKTLKWLAAKHPGRLALAAPFGQADHLTAWLRTAANNAKAQDEASALLIFAPSSNPFDEAELHRIAYLVGTHGALDEVGVAIVDDGAGLAKSVERLRRLGAQRIVTVPAGFADGLPQIDGLAADVEFAGALMSDASVLRVIRTRVRDALAALVDGHDGIDDGLMADHGHGYAHSHAFEQSQDGHTHSHDGHTHTHSHTPAHAHSH